MRVRWTSDVWWRCMRLRLHLLGSFGQLPPSLSLFLSLFLHLCVNVVVGTLASELLGHLLAAVFYALITSARVGASEKLIVQKQLN